MAFNMASNENKYIKKKKKKKSDFCIIYMYININAGIVLPLCTSLSDGYKLFVIH